MAELEINDAVGIFNSCLMIYKNRPAYIVSILLDRDDQLDVAFQFTDVDVPKMEQTRFIPEEWKAPERIGYFNYGGVAYYAKRYPLRKYKGGVCLDNTRVKVTGSVRGSRFLREVPFKSIEVAKAIKGEYPTLFKAWSYAKDIDQDMLNDGYFKCFAFDRQFAIDSLRRIYYCGEEVGIVPRGRMRIENIVFKPGSEYLMAALIGDYNETARLFGLTKG